MDLGWITITDGMFFFAAVILGVGLIAGGLVAYLRSPRVGYKALGATGVAVGVVMLAVVAFTAPVSVSGDVPSAPTVEEVIATG